MSSLSLFFQRSRLCSWAVFPGPTWVSIKKNPKSTQKNPVKPILTSTHFTGTSLTGTAAEMHSLVLPGQVSVEPHDRVTTSHQCPRYPLSRKRGIEDDLQLELLNNLALPAALGEQRQRCHLLPCRESLGDAKEGYSFCFNSWGLVWLLLVLSRRHKPVPALRRSTASPQPLEKKKKKNLKIKNKSMFPHIV